MQFAIAVASSTESWRAVKRAEELGFHAAWFYDTQLLNPDVFMCMTQAAMATEKIRLGTGVLIPSNRIEPVTANAFATLNQIAPGRVDFGVGTGFTGRRTMGLPAITLARMKSYIERVQGLLAGETIAWDFEGYDRKIRFLNPDFGLINLEDAIPLYISAFGPKSRKLTADLGAGWLNFGADVERAIGDLNAMNETWSAAGHTEPLDCPLFFLGCVLGEGEAADSERAIAQAGPAVSVFFHSLVETTEPGAMAGALPPEINDRLERYRVHYQNNGPADERYLENHRGHLMFIRDEEREFMDPAFIQQMTMTGAPEAIRDRLRALEQAGYTQFVVQLVEHHEDALEQWADVFATL